MERAEAEVIYDAGRDACVEFLVELTARYERQVTRLEARIERLEEKLRESFQNSSQPPSADPSAKRPAPQRSPSPRQQGGRPGHEGKTRKLVAEDRLDQIVDHWPERCSGCGACTRAVLPEGVGAGAFGPRLAAGIALLSVCNRISRRDALELAGRSSAPGMPSPFTAIASASRARSPRPNAACGHCLSPTARRARRSSFRLTRVEKSRRKRGPNQWAGVS